MNVNMTLVCRAYAQDLADWLLAERSKQHEYRILRASVARTTEKGVGYLIKLSWAGAERYWGKITIHPADESIQAIGFSLDRHDRMMRRGSVLIEPVDPGSFDCLRRRAWGWFSIWTELGKRHYA